jgi:hypothetical protein
MVISLRARSNLNPGRCGGFGSISAGDAELNPTALRSGHEYCGFLYTGSPFTPAQREGLRSLLTERDELITLLARSDPAATDLNVYSTYNLANNASSTEI